MLNKDCSMKNYKDQWTHLSRDSSITCLREGAAKFLQFCGTENFRFQFYDLIWLIIVFLSMLAINGGPVCQIGSSTDKKRN